MSKLKREVSKIIVGSMGFKSHGTLMHFDLLCDGSVLRGCHPSAEMGEQVSTWTY